MSDPVSISIEVPENCPPDIELMAIWAQALDRYKNELTAIQLRAAAQWFKSYIDSVTDEYEANP